MTLPRILTAADCAEYASRIGFSPTQPDYHECGGSLKVGEFRSLIATIAAMREALGEIAALPDVRCDEAPQIAARVLVPAPVEKGE